MLRILLHVETGRLGRQGPKAERGVELVRVHDRLDDRLKPRRGRVHDLEDEREQT